MFANVNSSNNNFVVLSVAEIPVGKKTRRNIYIDMTCGVYDRKTKKIVYLAYDMVPDIDGTITYKYSGLMFDRFGKDPNGGYCYNKHTTVSIPKKAIFGNDIPDEEYMFERRYIVIGSNPEMKVLNTKLSRLFKSDAACYRAGYAVTAAVGIPSLMIGKELKKLGAPKWLVMAIAFFAAVAGGAIGSGAGRIIDHYHSNIDYINL